MSLDHFKRAKDILLQTNDSAVPYTFSFSACTSITSNDGSLPYGTSISSVAVTAKSSTGTTVTSDIISSSSVAANIVTVALKYPTTNGVGKYHLTIVATLNTGAKLEFDFDRIYAEDR